MLQNNNILISIRITGKLSTGVLEYKNRIHHERRGKMKNKYFWILIGFILLMQIPLFLMK